MKIKTVVVTVIIIALAIFFLLKRKTELSRAPVYGIKPVPVVVCRAQKTDISEQVEYLVHVEAANTASVSSRITSSVEKLFVDEGSRVSKNDLLCLLDGRDLRATLNKAKQEEIAAAENFKYWDQEFKRDRNLFTQGAISEQERDAARNSFYQAKTGLRASHDAVNLYETRLSYVKILSPYAGVVSKRFVDVGDMALPGKSLFKVEDRSVLKLSFDVPQDDLPFLKTGQVISYLLGGEKKKAAVSSLFPSLNPGRMLHVEACPENMDGLIPGVFLSAKILKARRKNVVVVPETAICRPEPGNPYVFTVKNKKLKKVAVITGFRNGKMVEVSNLSEGTVVVENPYLSRINLSEGETVQIVGVSE